MKNENKCKCIFLDVDGVLTDGKKYIFEENIFKAFNVKDGMGIKKAIKKNIEVVIITTDNWNTIYQRSTHLGIKEKNIYSNCKNKLETAKEHCKKNNLKLSECCFMGDDINDSILLSSVGYPACPLDAVKEIRNLVSSLSGYIAEKSGGEGCVREIIDYLFFNELEDYKP